MFVTYDCVIKQSFFLFFEVKSVNIDVCFQVRKRMEFYAIGVCDTIGIKMYSKGAPYIVYMYTPIGR